MSITTFNGVSVIIPTINRADVLIDTINDILLQDFDNFEIIVVDQSEQVNEEALRIMTKSIVPCRYFKAKFKGLPQARNFGAQKASKDILLYIDDDIRCDTNLVKNHFEAHVKTGAQLIAGGITERGDVVNTNKAGSFNKWTATAISNFSSTKAGWCSHGKGCNFSVSKIIFDKVGGIDEVLSIGAALYEESEFALRLKESGYKAWFEPDAHLTHLAAPMGGCRVPNDWQRYMYGLGHNRAILVFRHLAPIYWPTSLMRTLLLGVSYSKLDKSPKPFFSTLKGLRDGRKVAKMPALNTQLEGIELSFDSIK